MDALIAAALTEVAAEGPQGCPLPTLWKLLQGAATAAGWHLDNTNVKQMIWEALLNLPCLTFKFPHSSSSSSPSIAQAVEDAEKLNVHLVASQDLRDSHLGIYDIKYCDSRLSADQRMTLEHLGKARSAGVAQFQLAKEFGMGGKKLFYVVRSLESRGLLVRQSSIFREGRGKAPVSTNLIHLKRYAKHMKIGSQQRFEIQKFVGSISSEHEEEDILHSTNLDTGGLTHTKDIRVNDDLPALKVICDRLAAADEKILVISDLKVKLGYRLAAGHRAWRRHLSRLKAAGLVDVLDANVEQKVVSCIRLIKPFDAKALSRKVSAVGSDEADIEQQLKGVKRGQVTGQVVELSINRQILNSIIQEGPEGLTITEMWKHLGLNNKRNYYRLNDMISKHGIRLEAENYKKSTLYRVRAPPEYFVQGYEGSSYDKHTQCSLSHDPLSPLADYRQVGGPADCSQAETVGKEQQMRFFPHSGQAMGTAVDTDPNQHGNDFGMEMINYGTEMINYDDSLREVESQEDQALGSSIPAAYYSPTLPKPSTPVSVRGHRFVALSTAHSQREVWIMERLQREKFVLRVELHKWLEDMQGRKDGALDRKTVVRNLQKLQQEGRCKCILLSIPGATNYARSRSVEVVLLPSVEVGPDLLNQVHDRQRALDMQFRNQGSARAKKSSDNIPMLKSLKKMEPEDAKTNQVVDKGATLYCNGFIPAKMVRACMLHQFLWTYVSLLAENNASEYSEQRAEIVEVRNKNTPRNFSLLNAVHTMPLKLFLQVIGSSKHIEHLTECSKSGLRICDLPVNEFDLLLDANASGRLSALADILRRLKLLRLVMLPGTATDDLIASPQATLAYTLEEKPYVEEPPHDPIYCLKTNVFTVSPRARHNFDLTSKETVDLYWQTLEYFFCGVTPSIANRAFPGTTVPEIFAQRSWSSSKLTGSKEGVDPLCAINSGLDRRDRSGSAKKRSCEQVSIVDFSSLKIRKKPRSSHKNCRQNLKKYHAEHVHALPEKKGHIGGENGKTEEKTTTSAAEEEDDDDDWESGFINHISVVRMLKPSRTNFFWSDSLDRALIACYASERAKLGARFNRVQWNLIQGLPGPPNICKRRIALLKMEPTIRNGILKLCTLLADEYKKHVELHAEKSGNKISNAAVEGVSWADFNNPSISSVIDEIIKCKISARASSLKKQATTQMVSTAIMLSSHVPSTVQTSNENIEVPMTNLEETLDKIAVPDRYLAGIDNIESSHRSIDRARNLENSQSRSRYKLTSQSNTLYARAHTNRVHVQKQIQRTTLLNNIRTEHLVKNSIGVANAVELIKMVFLNSSMEKEVSQVLVDALRRFKESDVFTAFKYLKDKDLVATVRDTQSFVLSSKFYNHASASSFPYTSSLEALRLLRWLDEHKAQLEQDWITLYPEQQCGELFHLFALVSSGELSLTPFLPKDGIGENEDQGNLCRKRKMDMDKADGKDRVVKEKYNFKAEEGGFGLRRERGFPGIQVSAHLQSMSVAQMLTPSCEETRCFVRDDLCSETFHPLYSAHELDDVVSSSDVSSLTKTYHKILSVGEEGVRVNQNWRGSISSGAEALDGTVSEACADALQSLGSVRKVMAFDHVRVVAGLHCESYFLHLPSVSANDSSGNQTIDADGRSKAGVQRGLIEDGEDNVGRFKKPDYCISNVTANNFDIQEQASKDEIELVPILPWLTADGKENASFKKGLTRRIMGIVMVNPGILEEDIVQQLDVLNPMSTRRLLQILELDGHLHSCVRMRKENASPPMLLRNLIEDENIEIKLVCNKHYYPCPHSTSLL